MHSFQNQTVFITGASAGIGKELAREFSKQGAHLAITARRKTLLDTLASELRAENHRVLTQSCDVTRDGDIEKAVEATVQEFGKIDVVIANAGFGVTGNLEDMSLEDYRRQFETNVFGVLRTIYATLNELKKSKGTLVLIGSVSGYISLPGGSPYGMSKFAVHALAQSITYELKKYGIGVVLIAPGFVESEIRQVDNQGHYQPQAKDPIPQWIVMPTTQAARKIVRAVAKRKQEEVITFHGKSVVFLKRHFPWIFSPLIQAVGLRARSQPKQSGAKKNLAHHNSAAHEKTEEVKTGGTP